MHGSVAGGFISRQDLGVVLFQPRKLGWTPVGGPCHSGWSVSPDKDKSTGVSNPGGSFRRCCLRGACVAPLCQQPAGKGSCSQGDKEPRVTVPKGHCPVRLTLHRTCCGSLYA